MVESLASKLGSWTLAPVRDVLLESISNLAAKVRKDKCFAANERDRPDSTGLSGSASILSRYSCHFNTLISPCLIRTHHRRDGDETWSRPPNPNAKTTPSPSISRIRPPTWPYRIEAVISPNEPYLLTTKGLASRLVAVQCTTVNFRFRAESHSFPVLGSSRAVFRRFSQRSASAKCHKGNSGNIRGSLLGLVTASVL